MKTLDQVKEKNPRIVAGLMSGTSCDGVDVAIVQVVRNEQKVTAELRAFSEHPFPPDLRSTLLALAEVSTSRIDDLCAANFEIARHYVKAIRATCSEQDVSSDEIDLIGSHGQTVHHLPDKGATLQIGEPAVLAEMFGVPVVADFRTRDMAAGGQGAPLVPYVDFLLLRDGQLGRAVQNIGGIANVTYLRPGGSAEEVIAFDTGPGNMVIDGLVHQLTDGKQNFDNDGEWAGRGRVVKEWLDALMDQPYFSQPPPKSTGREMFGAGFVQDLLEEAKSREISDDDLMTTATALTAESIARAYERILQPAGPIDEIILSGGGVGNSTLVRMIHELLPECRLCSSDEFGLPSAAKEAISFAILANETIDCRPNNLPSATGASRAVVLGKVVLPD